MKISLLYEADVRIRELERKAQAGGGLEDWVNLRKAKLRTGPPEPRIKVSGPLSNLYKATEELRRALRDFPDQDNIGPTPTFRRATTIRWWENILRGALSKLQIASKIIPYINPTKPDEIPMQLEWLFHLVGNLGRAMSETSMASSGFRATQKPGQGRFGKYIFLPKDHPLPIAARKFGNEYYRLKQLTDGNPGVKMYQKIQADVRDKFELV